jgi:hypothetical protein
MKLARETPEFDNVSKQSSPTPGVMRKSSSSNSTLLRCFLAALVLVVTGVTYYGIFEQPRWRNTVGSPTQSCIQLDPLAPPPDDNLDAQFAHIVSSPHFRNRTAGLLAGAVQVRSESFDDLDEVGKDDRWEVFSNVHDYLESKFPNVHKTLEKETVNKFGLLYTWKGKDESLKPLLLMAHQVFWHFLPANYFAFPPDSLVR